MADSRQNKSSYDNDSFLKIDPRFENLRPLGIGGNGMIFSATDSECDKDVAIKKLSFLDRKSCKYVLREIKIMRRLQHDNILRVYEVLGPNGYRFDRNNSASLTELSSLYLVQEHMDTDLAHIIAEKQISSEHVKLFSYQMLRGLKYIHSANVVHRDLKPGNILINTENLLLKIGDFGLARIVDSTYSHKGFLTDGVGTCWYRSPELIVSPRDYTKAIDIWSVACIMFEMVTGRPLFQGANEMDQIGRIIDVIPTNDNEWNTLTQILPLSLLRKRSKVPKSPLSTQISVCDANVLDLLEKMLKYSPLQRLTAEEALCHCYVQAYSSPEREPIVISPFHIEHEADNLSPQTMRRMISVESSESVEGCGSFISTSNNKHHKHDYLENSIEHRQLPLSEQLDSNVRSLSSSTESTKELELVLSEGENCKDKAEFQEYCKQKVFQNDKNYIFVDLPEKNIKDENKFGENKQMRVSQKELVVKKEKESEKEDCSLPEKEVDCLIVWEQIWNLNGKNAAGKHFTCPKVKDRLNEVKRAESPKECMENCNNNLKGQFDLYDSHKLTHKDKKTKGDYSKEIKMKRNKHYLQLNENLNLHHHHHHSQDFDSRYRLPTEHLTRRRNTRHDRLILMSNRVEQQLKLHEQLNAKLKLAELERERCFGAEGGNVIPPSDSCEDASVRHLTDIDGSRTRSNSDTSTHSGSSEARGDSPTNDSSHRRLEH